jgi:hypothetical protein
VGLLNDIGNVIQTGGNAAADTAEAAGDAAGEVVDAVVDAATGAGEEASDAASEETHAAATWILDVAVSLTNEAARATAAAGEAAAGKANEAAECARTWSMVASLIVIVVVVVVAIIVSVFTFGAAIGLVVLAVAASTAILAGINVAGIAGAAMVQAIVIAAIRAIVVLTNAAVSVEERQRTRRETIESLKRAMALVQSAAAQRLPATAVNIDKSLAAHERMLRSLQKLLALLRRRPPTPRLTMIASRLAQLEQAHAEIVARLRTAKVKIGTPVIGPPSPVNPVQPITLTTNAISLGIKR